MQWMFNTLRTPVIAEIIALVAKQLDVNVEYRDEPWGYGGCRPDHESLKKTHGSVWGDLDSNQRRQFDHKYSSIYALITHTPDESTLDADGSSEKGEETEKLLELIDRDFFRVYDGVTLFMIRGSGSLTADDLRIIANEMDRRSSPPKQDPKLMLVPTSSMFRFLLFGGEGNTYANGGVQDLVMTASTLESCQQFVKLRSEEFDGAFSWWHVLDTETGEVVAGGEYGPIGAVDPTIPEKLTFNERGLRLDSDGDLKFYWTDDSDLQNNQSE